MSHLALMILRLQIIYTAIAYTCHQITTHTRVYLYSLAHLPQMEYNIANNSLGQKVVFHILCRHMTQYLIMLVIQIFVCRINAIFKLSHQ